MKRIVLFLATNLAVIVVLGIVLRLFGLDRAAYSATGLDYTQLLLFSAIIGFTGAIISLLISKPMAKWQTGAHVITASANADERWLLDTVNKLSSRAGIRMPEVAIYEGRAQCIRDRSIQELSARRRFHRAAPDHEPRGGGGRPCPRGRPRGERRHGDDDAHPRCREHVRRVPFTHRWLRRR